MLWLGFWQLQKSTARAEALALYETQIANSSLYDATDATRPPEFAQVAARGTWVSERFVLIDNISRNGRSGCFVIGALALEDGRTLLVNRGWLALDASRSPVGLTAPGTGPQSVVGRVGRLPAGGIRLGDNPTQISEWPPLLVFPDLAELEQLLERPLIEWVLLETDSNESAYEQSWSPGGLPPERHLGYAVQWFAMAIALTLLMGIAGWRSRRSERRDADN